MAIPWELVVVDSVLAIPWEFVVQDSVLMTRHATWGLGVLDVGLLDVAQVR
jgi:hypothetical protein